MASMAATESFRQAGKFTGGNGTVHKGMLTGQRSGKKVANSIPSKFETTLFTGNKEKNAFGMRAHRFFETENDLPGPGAYDGVPVAARDDKIYSKKGLGVGFVSKTKRDSGFVKKNVTPGPGNYNQPNTLARSLEQSTRYNVGGSTGAFAQPSKRGVTVMEEPQPGPGQYKAPSIFEPQRNISQLGASAAMAKPSQLQVARAAQRMTLERDTPAPGQYDPRPAELRYADSVLPSASFRSSVPNAGAQLPPRVTKEQELGVVARQQEGAAPGPGYYELPKPNFASSRRRMPQFCDTTLDRFGKAQPRVGRYATAPSVMPGPGTYHREPVRETAPISSAAFMSGSVRVDKAAVPKGVPGPAYYKPDVYSGRKSFHLNSVQRWMPGV